MKSTFGLAVAALIGFASVYDFSVGSISQAVDASVKAERDKGEVGAKDLQNALSQIYQNIRTLSFLPDVQTMDRHATNLGPSAKPTMQQIYNNLWSNVTVSEIYFTPENFDPRKIDPVTKESEKPALMFDDMITSNEPEENTNSAAAAATAEQPEVEDEEYALIVKQIS